MTAKFFGADSTLTLAEFEQNALRVADVLTERGIGPGDRVLLKAGNSIAYVSTLFALMHVGASIVLLDPQERAEETRFIAGRAGARWSLVDDDAALTEDHDRIYLYELAVAAAGRTPSGQALDFTGWGERPDGLIMWSSGSTGTPKGIVRNGGKFLRNLERNAAQVGHVSTDVLLPLLPFSHQYGLSMVLIAWLVRCSLVIAPYKRLDRALRQARQTGATVVDATPATYRSILNIVARRPAAVADFHAVRMLCVGAAPLDPGLVQRAIEVYGMPLLDSYGSTEMGNVAFATNDNPVGTGQVMAGLAVRIVDTGDSGEEKEVPPGVVGEILLRTPDMMEGYLDLNGEVRPVELEDGWFRTNDLGHVDEHGNLFVAGRKFAVQRNGYVLYPEIIERKLAAGGCSVKIVPTPDERRGAQLAFFVEDEQLRDVKYWRELICAVLPPFEQPNSVRVLERFPLNHNGKPDRKQLEQLIKGIEVVPV